MSTTESAEPLAEHWTRSTLRRYAELTAHADHVADIIYAVRFGGSKTDYFRHSFDADIAESTYWWRGENDSIQWPLDLLWADDDTIRQRTLDQIEDEKRKDAEEAARRRVDEEARDRRRYEELKARFG